MEKASHGNLPLLADEWLVCVNGTPYRMQLLEKGVLNINGTRQKFDFQRVDANSFSLILENISFTIFEQKPPATLEESHISVNGHNYRFTIEDRISQIRKSALTIQRDVVVSDTLRAPMPGLVVNVEVSEGVEVRVGQGLIVLEAMKMENEIRAAFAGRVKIIHVSRGKVVEKGEPLISLERN
ncbi:MAG: acetyl-CoA carboxylase biotin carboxyl carrier protein subunit [Ignavibacteriales bacterium]|nr:acetyl-CoA carboxylase biotin carboxyl carrier protein subunit [Ignavibacteriales bacterium]